MHNKNCFRWAFGMLLMLSLQWPVSASVMLGGTRVILGEKDREASIPVKNTGTSPYVVQTWIDAGEGNTKTPLLVTPPLSRLDPGMENILRIMRVGGGLPADRESVFRLNVKEIPEKPDTKENTLQIAVRTRIKLFYRPANLPGKAFDARTLLKWVVSAGEGGQGAVLRIGNASAYHVTFTGLKINGGQQEINADMVPPYGEMSYPLDVKTPQAIEVSYTTLNDYGGETPREKVQVPAGTEPVAVKAERMAPPADAAKP